MSISSESGANIEGKSIERWKWHYPVHLKRTASLCTYTKMKLCKIPLVTVVVEAVAAAAEH